MPKPPRHAAQLGRNLRGIRQTRHLTQRQIAAVLGVHRPAVTLMESGTRPPTIDELLALARFYDTPLTEVLLARIPTDSPYP